VAKVGNQVPADSQSIARHRHAMYLVVPKDSTERNLEKQEGLLWNTMDTPSLAA
jgi:hypothetical protein